MHKVAICLSGATSKIGERFLTQGSLYNKGEYVNVEVCYNSIIKHIVQPSANCIFDFFIHSWNEDLEEKLVSLYKPQRFLFENNSIYNHEITSKITKPADFAGASKALSMQKSILLLEQYQREYNFEYERIIVYRPDIILLKDINLNNYDQSKIYVNKFLNGQGDFHFIMNAKNLSEFKNLYNSLNKGNVVDTHFWIKYYINNFMKSSLEEDDIVAGEDQEVIRKIYTKINQNINIGALSGYGLTEQELLRYSGKNEK